MGVRRRTAHDDRGVTLIEVMVSALITSIVLAGIATVLVATTSITRTALVRSNNSRDLRGAAEVVTASLRVSVVPPGGTLAVTQARPDRVQFYAMLNRTGAAATTTLSPTLVSYWYDTTTTCLMQQRTVGVPLSPVPAVGLQHSYTSGTQTRCVAKTTTPPAFSYFTSSSATTPITNSSTGLGATALATVRSVQLQLTVQNPANTSVPGSTVLDRVALTNVP